MSMGPEPPQFWEDRCVLCGYGEKARGRLHLVHAECAAHVHETEGKPDATGKARLMYQEEVAALREQIRVHEATIARYVRLGEMDTAALSNPTATTEPEP